QEEQVHLREEARAGRVHVEGRYLEPELARDVAGVRRREEVRRGAPRDHEADLRWIDPGARDRHPRGARAERGGAVAGRFGGRAQVAVARRADVVEREARAPRADADALEDPRVARPDVELLEEAVGDLVLGVEVAETVEPERQWDSPRASGGDAAQGRESTFALRGGLARSSKATRRHLSR